jgi:hypothetical protein
MLVFIGESGADKHILGISWSKARAKARKVGNAHEALLNNGRAALGGEDCRGALRQTIPARACIGPGNATAAINDRVKAGILFIGCFGFCVPHITRKRSLKSYMPSESHSTDGYVQETFFEAAFDRSC